MTPLNIYTEKFSKEAVSITLPAIINKTLLFLILFLALRTGLRVGGLFWMIPAAVMVLYPMVFVKIHKELIRNRIDHITRWRHFINDEIEDLDLRGLMLDFIIAELHKIEKKISK